jgi:hypothetical protein
LGKSADSIETRGRIWGRGYPPSVRWEGTHKLREKGSERMPTLFNSLCSKAQENLDKENGRKHWEIRESVVSSKSKHAGILRDRRGSGRDGTQQKKQVRD